MRLWHPNKNTQLSHLDTSWRFLGPPLTRSESRGPGLVFPSSAPCFMPGSASRQFPSFLPSFLSPFLSLLLHLHLHPSPLPSSPLFFLSLSSLPARVQCRLTFQAYTFPGVWSLPSQPACKTEVTPHFRSAVSGEGDDRLSPLCVLRQVACRFVSRTLLCGPYAESKHLSLPRPGPEHAVAPAACPRGGETQTASRPSALQARSEAHSPVRRQTREAPARLRADPREPGIPEAPLSSLPFYRACSLGDPSASFLNTPVQDQTRR